MIEGALLAYAAVSLFIAGLAVVSQRRKGEDVGVMAFLFLFLLWPLFGLLVAFGGDEGTLP